jgi:UDP-N-acetylglucosamine 2-epimerase (non-hydrolysing)
MGFSAVSARDSIERPEAIDLGSIQNPGIGSDELVRSVSMAMKEKKKRHLPEGYEEQDFSGRVMSILFSTVNQGRQDSQR